MSDIIRQLLGFARRQPGMKTRGDLAASISKTMDLLRPMARKAGVEVSLESSGEPHFAWVDHAQIQQVLTNLLVNAIQACRGGGVVRVEVAEVSATPRGQPGDSARRYHSVLVEDDGLGIAPEDLEHVFDPFFTRKEVGSGTGLGLSFAQGIVHDHGGWIEVASVLGLDRKTLYRKLHRYGVV